MPDESPLSSRRDPSVTTEGGSPVVGRRPALSSLRLVDGSVGVEVQPGEVELGADAGGGVETAALEGAIPCDPGGTGPRRPTSTHPVLTVGVERECLAVDPAVERRQRVLAGRGHHHWEVADGVVDDTRR